MTAFYQTDTAQRLRSLLRATASAVTALLLLAGISLLAGAIDTDNAPVEFQLTEIQPSTFRSQLEVKGIIEPLESEVVTSDCYWTTRILSIVPEGTWVQKGDVVCVLDSAEIEDFARTREVLLIKYRGRLDGAVQDQELLKSQNERRLSSAQFKLDTAQRELAEYREGTFPQQLEEMEQNLSMLAEQRRSTGDEVRHTEKLWAMGMVSRSEMEAGSLKLLQAQQKFDRLASQLDFMTDFSNPRQTLKLEYTASDAERNLARTRISNSLALTRAQLTTLSYERTLRIYERYYRRAVDSIKACTLRAPCDGQVIHGNSWHLKSRGITQIEEGKSIRRLQKVFEIPNLSRLKVSVPLSESLVYKVKEGMPVTITLPGQDDVEVAGSILNVSRYPRMRSSYTPHLKDYWLDVELLPTEDQQALLKPRADVVVNMVLSEIPNMLQIPRDAVTGLAGHNFVFVFDGKELQHRKVTLTDANSETVCVTEGLSSGDQLVTGMLPEHQEALNVRLRKELGLSN